MIIEDSNLYIPNNLYDDYFLKAYINTRARLTSNSWGDSNGMYDAYCEGMM
jgi:hypothetical protein